MRAGLISTASFWAMPRASMQRMQADLTRMSSEVVTGRMADPGLDLGAKAAQITTLHIDISAFDSAVSSNRIATARLEHTGQALGNLRKDAEDFLNQLLTSKTSKTPLDPLAGSALAGFITAVNASDGRNFLFAGINSDTQPIADFATSPKAAIDAAFLAKFGVTQTDPLVDQISTTDMADFLDNEFADLFADPAWGADWSSASDQALKSRISPSETIETSATANEPALRKLAMIYSMTSSLAADSLAEPTRQVLLDKAIALTGEVVTALTDREAELGDRTNRVSAATERLEIQKTMFETHVGRLEGVDPAETKVKIDTLTAQLQMSYALTGKLLRLSLLNYI